jgi:hypothetical protein
MATGIANFATTHWSVVLAAGHGTDPLYAFLRREGHRPEDAQDLVQGFFLHLLQKDILRTAEAGRGRFRSFLLGTLKHYLSDEQDKAEAQKRGGGQQFISWDLAGVEGRFQQETADESSPDRLFERCWALTILEQASGPHRGRAGGSRRGTPLHARRVQSRHLTSSAAAQLSAAVCPVQNADAQRGT